MVEPNHSFWKANGSSSVEDKTLLGRPLTDGFSERMAEIYSRAAKFVYDSYTALHY